MKKNIFLSAFLFCTIYCNAQSDAKYDSLRRLCNDVIFYLCEESPYLKNGTKQLEDSLKADLVIKNKLPLSGMASVDLIVMANGTIGDIRVTKAATINIQDITSALYTFSGLWMPGKQNGHLVCCHMFLDINFTGNKIEISKSGPFKQRN
jgi:hypothetical protein